MDAHLNRIDVFLTSGVLCDVTREVETRRGSGRNLLDHLEHHGLLLYLLLCCSDGQTLQEAQLG